MGNLGKYILLILDGKRTEWIEKDVYKAKK